MCSCQIAADLILKDGSAKPNIPGMSILVLHHFLFPSFLNPKTTKNLRIRSKQDTTICKKSSKCYQCISGFKYCSSPEISSSVLGIQDQGGGSLWSLFLGIVLEVEAKVKEGGGASTGHWLSNQVEEGCSGSLTVLDKTLITDCQCQAEGIFSSVSWVH